MPGPYIRAAAGRSLTVGELMNTLSRLHANDPVTINGNPVLDVDPSAHGLDIDFGHDCEDTRAYDLLWEIAGGKETKAAIVASARDFTGRSKAA